MPDRPELLTDWGNAALGAGDVATATLAYRRALAIDGGNARARHNLDVAAQPPARAVPAATAAPTDTLFFFHAWPRSHALLVGALAFALAILLLVPWGGRRRRALTGLALLPAAMWIAMLVSLVLEDRRGDDAVVDGRRRAARRRQRRRAGRACAAVCRAAPRSRSSSAATRWTKIRLANGTAGWVPAAPSSAVAQ